MTKADLLQLCITLFSCCSIWLFSGKKYYKWGFIAGICGQPFWIWAAFHTDPLQWGIGIVSLWYTFNHLRGIKNHWRRKNHG